MNSQDYIANAVKTESRPETLKFGKFALHAILSLGICSSALLDAAKKSIYYGKPIDGEAFDSTAEELTHIATFLIRHRQEDLLTNPDDCDAFSAMLPKEIDRYDLDNVNLRLLHSALGIFTEAGEMLEAILKQFGGEPLDVANFAEELGDVDWYKAIAHDETGISEEQLRETNIAKLKARYPGKFVSQAAINRDLNAERKVLEDGAGSARPQNIGSLGEPVEG